MHIHYNNLYVSQAWLIKCSLLGCPEVIFKTFKNEIIYWTISIGNNPPGCCSALHGVQDRSCFLFVGFIKWEWCSIWIGFGKICHFQLFLTSFSKFNLNSNPSFLNSIRFFHFILHIFYCLILCKWLFLFGINSG